MASVSNFALRLPPSLMEDVKAIAANDSVSVNQFIVQAVAERVAMLRDRGYLALRRARAKPGDMMRILAKCGRRHTDPRRRIAGRVARGTAARPVMTTHPALTAVATNQQPVRRS